VEGASSSETRTIAGRARVGECSRLAVRRAWNVAEMKLRDLLKNSAESALRRWVTAPPATAPVPSEEVNGEPRGRVRKGSPWAAEEEADGGRECSGSSGMLRLLDRDTPGRSSPVSAEEEDSWSLKEEVDEAEDSLALIGVYEMCAMSYRAASNWGTRFGVDASSGV